ncbi:MAG: ABC transporter substrate-binding protein, partial [Solirubrobacterales bacterium]
EVQAATFDQLGDEPNIETVKASQPAFTQLTFNLCTEKICPDANFNPAVQDRAVRQAIAYAIDRGRINAIAGRNTSFPAHGLLPSFYKSFYERPAMDYPLDVAKANQILDQAGYTREGDGVRSKDGNELSFNLYVRSESPYNVQAAKLAAEQVATIGVKFNVQVVSTDKMYEVTLREVDGKPAPDFDTFIWGWGGDPYDPSFLLQLLTTRAIADKTSDSFYSNPAYDRLFDEQAGAFDTAERREIVQRMVAINQRDLAYLVLTYDPNLQAYRTDKLANVERICPEDETGDIFCESIGYSALLNLEPGESSGEDGGGGGTGIVIAIIAVIAAAIVFFVVRSRRRSREPVELEE